MAKIQFTSAQKPTTGGLSTPRRPAHEIIDQIGGGSPYGSTTYKRARLCPYEDGLVRIAKLRPTRVKEELDVGWIAHACREAYYKAILEHQTRLGDRPPRAGDTRAYEHYFWGATSAAEQAALAVADAYKDEPGYYETWGTVVRVISGYMEHWRRQDRWQILAVEETLIYEEFLKQPTVISVDSETGQLDKFAYSARLDLVLFDHDTQRRGLWADEFKTARWISEDLLDGYQLDMQVLGQVWLAKRCIDLEHYGPLKGVIVDVVSKQTNPKCERVYVSASPYHLASFEMATRQWALTNKFNELIGHPRALGSCASALRGYSRCQYYDLCHGKPENTVADWAEGPPPDGFYREERMLEDPEEYNYADYENYA